MALPDHLPSLHVMVSEMQTSSVGTVAAMYPVALPPSGILPSGVLQLRFMLVEVAVGAGASLETGSVYIVVLGAPGAGAAFSPETSEPS